MKKKSYYFYKILISKKVLFYFLFHFYFFYNIDSVELFLIFMKTFTTTVETDKGLTLTDLLLQV